MPCGVSGESLKTEGTASAKVLRVEHDCRYRKSKVVRAEGQSRAGEAVQIRATAGRGHKGHAEHGKALRGGPSAGF